MLEEIDDVKPEPGGEKRRWFRDEYFDLFVWSDAQGIRAFELCYDKLGDERLLAWRRGGEVTHAKVDSGEDNPSKNNTPIVVAGKEIFPARMSWCASRRPARSWMPGSSGLSPRSLARARRAVRARENPLYRLVRTGGKLRTRRG